MEMESIKHLDLKKSGKEKTDRARRYAELVFKDCDAAAVETIIEKENEFGIDKMAKAAKVVAAMVTHNPHRSLDYFLGIVRTPDPPAILTKP
jgi:hypothetical protein